MIKLSLNMFITSLIFTVILLILINIVLFDYKIDNKHHIYLFMSLFAISLFSINIYKQILINENNASSAIVIKEVFKELNDNREIVKHTSEPVKPIIQGQGDFEIEFISPILTNK